ncbi:hypothetical protein AAE02nite_42640 [Adhaeribacter aerolatus]|uniref:DUF5723 domain-containing protein n=1 Tax=Adhaeribacter aerolatus TaxID=670289 RepID=A0A512B3R9_9BACT|nr:DUF5723 family protein [Adhaeribacter aerolatus]GEO06600.1 hypothetical protein AAE02nite_42640 [Adhaeribacter aerolatus]
MKKNLLLTTFVAMAVCGQLKAQQLLGVANSNFAGINGLPMNPASIVDSRLGFQLNLVAFDVNLSNNYMRYNAPNSIIKMLRNDGEFDDTYLEENFNGKPKMFTTSMDFRGPSFMVTLSPKHSLAFTTPVRGAFQGNNISENLAKLIDTKETDDLLNKVNDGNEFSLNGNLNQEYGLAYGRELYNTGKHVLKGGLNVKRVTGIYSSYLVNEDLRFKLTERTDANAEPYNVLEIENINTRYGYVTNDDFSIEEITNTDDPVELARNMGKWLTNGGALGKGWGMDLGFTYEYRPQIDNYKYTIDSVQYLNHRKNKYKYRLGISLMDVGGVRYKSPDVHSLDISRQRVEIDFRDFEDLEKPEDATEVLNESFGIQPSDIRNSFRTGLPTTLNINLDTRITSRLYVSTTWIQSLRGKTAVAMRQNSLLALTPRLEYKMLELAMPISLHNNYSVFGVGAMVKLGSFFIGSDNIGGALNVGKPYGANVYMGVSLLALKREIKKAPKAKKVKTQPSTPVVVPAPATTPASDSTATPQPIPVPTPVKE